MTEQSTTYIPLVEVAKHLEMSKDKLYYYFNANEKIAKKYIKSMRVKKGNGYTQRYFVDKSFISYYHSTKTTISEDKKEEYEKMYYAYIEKEEARLNAEGKSKNTDNQIFKDMDIIDAHLSKQCLVALSAREGRKATSYDRKHIGNIVYRHVFAHKFYFDICFNVLVELEA